MVSSTLGSAHHHRLEAAFQRQGKIPLDVLAVNLSQGWWHPIHWAAHPGPGAGFRGILGPRQSPLPQHRHQSGYDLVNDQNLRFRKASESLIHDFLESLFKFTRDTWCATTRQTNIEGNDSADLRGISRHIAIANTLCQTLGRLAVFYPRPGSPNQHRVVFGGGRPKIWNHPLTFIFERPTNRGPACLRRPSG